MTEQVPDWLTYEQLATQIYTKLEPNAVVKHDDRIYGRMSERERQIDVSIRSKVAGHDILVIVDAKDRSRAPHVQNIGEFAEMMQDVGATRGVMVCRKRPTDENIQYAARRGIDICTAIDVSDKNWQETISLPVIVNLTEYDIVPQLFLSLTADLEIQTPDKWLVSVDDGKSHQTLDEFMLDMLEPASNSVGPVNVATANDALKALFGGKIWMPFGLRLEGQIRKRSLFRFFSPTQYQALRNYSNGLTLISNLHLDIPDWNDPSQWNDPSEFNSVEPDLFIVAELLVGGWGIRKQQVRTVQKVAE